MTSQFFQPLRELMRWGPWAPVAIAMGAMLYFSLGEEPPFYILYITTGSAAGFMLLAFGLRRWPIFYIACLGIMWFMLGFAAGMARTSLASHWVLPQKMEQPVMAHGTVDSVDDLGKSGLRIILSEVDLWKIPLAETPKRIRIVARSKNMPEIVPGDRIAVRVSLSPPPRPVFPHGYDFARMIYFDEIGAIGFSVGTPYILKAAEGQHRALARHRHHITERIYDALADEHASIAGITAAMITGETGRITQEDLDSLRASGLAHILSISGLHMVLAASILFVGVRMFLALFPFIVLHYPIKKWAAAAAIAASFYYLLIAGAPVPAERAYIMLTLFFIAVMVDRTTTPLYPIALAAGFLILVRPESILHPSFQMSFAAVIALCAYFQEPDESLLKHHPIYKASRHLCSIAMASVVAGTATAPFAFHHFGQYAVYGLFANMLVVPLASFVIMPAGILALLMMPIGLESFPLYIMAKGISGMMWVSDRITALPFSTLSLPHMNVVPLLWIVFGGLWICLWVKQLRWLGFIPIFIGICLYVMQPLPDVVLEERGKLFAIRDPQMGMAVPARTHARYARQYWSKALGFEDMKRFDELPMDHPLHSCTASQCKWQIENISFFRGAECEAADVLILTDTQSCTGNLLTVTQDDLEKNGTHAIWIRDGNVKVESVEAQRGHRPWTTQ